MKTLTTIETWILICSIVVTSSTTVEHASSHHKVSHHGDKIPQKKYQNTIVPFGIQIPEHVLSTQDVACISADSNIFEIMYKAQETCNGTDMRCTFYHFVNHGYQNIGTLDIDKELFDDLLMKFDNWLLTAENIEKNDAQLDEKIKKDSFLDIASINVNGSCNNEEQNKNSTNFTETARLYTNQGVNTAKLDHNTNESDDDEIVNTHHIKHFDETHHRNHRHKWKNGNHIKLVPEYNNDHRYFEVFLPKNKETGKPRTIYVEVDRDKNEFVLLDEEIDKKLNGIKPIRIELDELSEIADTAFNNIATSLNHKQHIYNSYDDHSIITSDVNTAINEDTINLDVEKSSENTLNSSVCNPNICNINANQQLIPDNRAGNVKKIVNVSKILVVPNKYTNQAQFYVESLIDNATDVIPNEHLGLLESTNDIDIHQTGSYEETPLDTVELNENNTNIDLDLVNVEYSIQNENVSFNDDSCIELEENNNTSNDIDFDDTHDFSLSNKLHHLEPILQAEKPVQENKLKSSNNIYTEPKLTSYLSTGISDYIGSQLDAILSENREGPKSLQDHSSVPITPLSPHTTVPILEKDLAEVLETDRHLQSSFPAYATLDLPAGASQNTPLNSDIAHPSISFFDSPLESNFGHQTTTPKISTIFPSPPVEYVAKINKSSKYSPLNFGFSWLPSYSRIEELRLPCAVNSSPKESIMSLPELNNKHLTDSICPEPSASDHTIPDADSRLFQTVPSLNVYVQEPSLTTEPYNLVSEMPMPLKPVLPSTLDVPKSNTELDRISTSYQLSETPFSVMPDRLKDAVNSPCPMQKISPYLKPTKPNQDLGYIKHSPVDNNSEETMIPCSPCKNRYPYTTIPYFLNPYLQPQYLEPLVPEAPLQSASKIPTLDSLPLSSDQSNPYINGDYSKATKLFSLLPFAPNIPFLPLNPLLQGSGFAPNTLHCQNLWNNIPYLPCTILPDQNIRNYPPIINNYLTPSPVLQQDQILKPLLSKAVSLSVPDHPCPIKNILEMTPPSYASFSPVCTPPIQMDLSPPLALERDLQSISLKYGIPLSKILNSLEAEISDAHSKTCSPTFEIPYSSLVHDSSQISKPILSKTNGLNDDENRSDYEESFLKSDLSNLIPLDSSLIGPHLKIESSLMLESNDSQKYTVSSETVVPPYLNLSFENEPTTVLKDSSLIGPHLSTLSTTNFVLSDENQNANEAVISESDISNLIPLDSFLIGPHLEIGNPPVLDSNNSHGDILTSHTKLPITISSQTEPKLNIQNQSTNLVLDSSLIVSHLPSLSPVKPLLSNEIQIMNDMVPPETGLTDITLLDSSFIDTQEDFVNQLQQSEILQNEKPAVKLSAASAISELQKPSEYLPTNLVEEQLDSSLIGPDLQLGSSSIIIDSLGDKTVPLVSKESLQNTDSKVEELENIILPSSLLPTLLNKPVKIDSNLNIITQETKLNEELDESSLDNNVELPLIDISLIPYKETDFKIVELIPELSLHVDDSNIPLLIKDSRTLKQKSKSSDMSHMVDSETLLDSSLTGTSILHKLEQPEIFTSIDSSIHLDSSLIGPSILQKINSREISPILDSVNHLESSSAATTINQNEKSTIDSSIKIESSLKGPSIQYEINSQETTTAFDSFDKSLVPSLHETKESSATTSVLSSSQLVSSLTGSSLKPEEKTREVCRAFDSKDLLDISLTGPHLLTVPLSSDKIQMINEELKPESGTTNLVPLDSSLVGLHIDSESESTLISVTKPEVYKTTQLLPFDLVEGTPLEPTIVPSVCTSDQQELLSKFTKAITKSKLSPSELKPCDKLLSSIPKISADNKNISTTCTELQTLTEYSPITMTSPTHEFSPVEPFVKLPPCLNSNYFPTAETLIESLPYAQGVPQIPITPHSPFVQMKPLIDRNYLPQPLNFQNILQNSPSFRPVVANAPSPFISNTLITEDQPLLDLTSHSKLYPQLSIPHMYSPGDAIAPSSEWTTTSNILPLDKYIPLLPKKNPSGFPSKLESTISNSEYNPIVVDDIMSLLDENSYQLLKDMSILPFSQSSLPPTISVFEKGEIISPSLLDTVPKLNSDYNKMKPLLPTPTTNPLVSSSIYNPQICLYTPQNIPYMIQTPNIISPCNLQPYSNIPLRSQFSETIGPAPKIITLPTEFSEEFLQQLLSKPCVESPITLPSSSLDTTLQLPTYSNELNSVPCQLPPEYFTPISSIYTTPLSNAFAKPTLPISGSPISVYLAKPISTPSTSLPLNVGCADSPLTSLPLPINHYTARPHTPKFSSPLMPLKITPILDYPYPPTKSHNRPLPSAIPYKPSETYSRPYLPVHASPVSINTSPGLQNITSKLLPAMTSPISPVFYEPLSTPYFSPLPKSLINLGLPAYSGPLAPISLSTLAPTPTGPLSPSYLSPDIPTYSYSSLSAPVNTETRPSNLLTSAYITSILPESSSYSSYNMPLSFNPKITPPELKSRLLNTLPIPNAVNPFLNTNQRLPINTKTLPMQSYSTHVPKSSPLTNLQKKQNIPYKHNIESNLLTSPLTEEIPYYDVIEESTYSYSNDEDDKFYEETKLKYPLESLSYTLAPAEIIEALPNEDFIKQEDLTPSAPVNNRASEPSLETKLYQHHRLTPYTPLHGKPLLINSKTLPMQSYSTHVPKSSPLSNLQIKQNIPYKDNIEYNLLTSPLTEEIPNYDVIEESTYTYSNDEDDKFYEKPKFKYPLESLSYTLSPEEITEALPNEDFIKQEDLTPSAPVNNRASEPSLQTKLYLHHRLTPYTPLHSKPLLKPRPTTQLLQPPALIETIPQNIFDNIPLVPLSRPPKHPDLLPTSILSSPLLKPLTPLTSAPNFPIFSPLLHSPCIDTSLSPYNKLPMNEMLQSLPSSPYFAPSQDRYSASIYPKELRNIVTPQVTQAFSQIEKNEPFVPVSLPIISSKAQPSILPYILDNIQLPSSHNEPKSKTLTSQGSLVKPIPNYTQYAAPIISHIPSLEMPIIPQYITSFTSPEKFKKPLISPKYISTILPAQTTLQDSLPLSEAVIHYQPPTAFTSAEKSIFMSPPVALPYSVLPPVTMIEPVTDLNRPQSSLTPQYPVPVSSLPVSKSSPIVSNFNVPYSRIHPKQALPNHVIPSSLFISPLHSIPRKSYPSLSLMEPSETVPFYTPNRPLDTPPNRQNILKPLPQYALPLSSSPCLTQLLQPTDSYQSQPFPNVQYTTKPYTKISPVPAQYTTPSSSPIYTSLPLETVPKQIINRPNAPQYSLPSAPVYDSPKHILPSGRNPFINPDFKPITEEPLYPVPKNIISSPIPTLSKSILLPLDISEEPQNLYSSPITAPLFSSSLPLAKNFPQKSRQYKPHIIPSNSQYVSQLPIESVPEFLQSTSSLLKSSLLKPLLTNSQNKASLLPMQFSNTNKAFRETFPIEAVPSVTSPHIALSNYLPSDISNHKYSGSHDSLVSDIPGIMTPINSTTPFILLKSPFNKHFKSPVTTPANMPLYSNYGVLEHSPKLPIKANIINTDKPVEVSAISASELSPLSLNSLDIEIKEENIEPDVLMPDLEDIFSQLPPGHNQQRQLHTNFDPKYLPRPQLSHARLPLLNRISQISPSKIPSFNAPSLLSDATELVDTTDFISMSQIKSEPLISSFDDHSSQTRVSSTDRKVPIPNTLSNIPDLNILQLLPYTTLLNTDFPPPLYKQLPSLYDSKIPQPSPIYLSPQEYKDLTQGSSPYQTSSSSPTVLSSTNIDPQSTTNPLTVRPRPKVPFYTSPMSIPPDNWLQSPIFKKSLPVHEKLIEVTAELESIPTVLNKYEPVKIYSKITPQENKYPYEPKSTISAEFSELDSVKPLNHLLKSKEHYTEYIDDLDPELDNVSFNDNKPDLFEAKPTKNLPELIKGLSVSNYNNKAQGPPKLSKLNHFYANNHVKESPQVFTVPTDNISPIDCLTDVASPYTTKTPEILKDFTNIPTRYFGSDPKLGTYSLRPNEFYPETVHFPENLPTTNSYPQNYLNPCLRYSSQLKSPLNTIEITDPSEITPTSYAPYNKIDDIKYSGYKTYQLPSFKSPHTPFNLGTPTEMYNPSVLTNSSPIPAIKPLKDLQNPSPSHFYGPAEICKPLNSQNEMTTPLQTKLNHNTLLQSPELNEYNPIEDMPISKDSINEDDELKTSLINYINKSEDVKNTCFNNNAELIIPIGKIAISKKEPYNGNTIETNNPSIGLKVWKSNVKIAEAELKLKFKDLSVNNFMPIVNNLDRYDTEEIRKIVKKYIDEKYGNHIEIHEPYTIDNKYTVIKGFDPNAVHDEYNLLWPTNYV